MESMESIQSIVIVVSMLLLFGTALVLGMGMGRREVLRHARPMMLDICYAGDRLAEEVLRILALHDIEGADGTEAVLADWRDVRKVSRVAYEVTDAQGRQHTSKEWV